MSALVSEAGGGFHFSGKRAGPQNHETVGHAERTIRWIKESVRTLMLEFQKQGLTLTCERVFVQRLLSYVRFSYNNFNLVQGSNKTPREIAVGSKVSQDCFALFGSKVLAEVPQSILERSPNMPRFISAAFIHPEFQSSGSVVIGKIRVGHKMITRCFVAKSFKLVLPIEILNEFGLFTQLVDERSGLPIDSGSGPSSMENRVLPQGQNPSLTCPSSGPPLPWVEEHGCTKGCSACKSVELPGTRKNKIHSKDCCLRYSKWIQEQARAGEASVPSVGGGELLAGEGGADPESLAEFEQLLEDTAGAVRGPKGMEVAEGLELFGASGQLGRHGVSHDFSVDDFSNVSPGPEPAKKRLKSQPVSGDTPSSPKYTPSSPEFLGSGPPSTPGCPSCQTGMNAPGCRHSAKCQRAHEAWFEARRVSVAGNDEYIAQV